MIYLNSNKINKLGGINKVYLNGRPIYQAYVGGKVVPDEPEKPVTQFITVDLNDQWELSTKDLGDGYTVYQSFSNYNVGDSVAVMRITFGGYETFSFKYLSNGENNFDYLCVSHLNKSLMDFSSNQLNMSNASVKYSTYDENNVIQDAEYTNLKPENKYFIDIAYRKDGSVDRNDDRGYVGVILGDMIEKWEVSTTEFITVTNADGTYTFYTKEYKYISFDDGKSWVKTATYRQGDTELEQSLVTVDGYICDGGNKYGKSEIFVNLDDNLVGTAIYSTGELLEENASECQFINNFLFNYNFNDYSDGVVPNRESATFANDLTLYGTPNVMSDGKNNYININDGNAFSYYKFQSESDNVFIPKNDKLTFICKVSGGSGPDLFSCRWSDGYVYMVRPYTDYLTLHTPGGEQGQISTDIKPTVYAMTVSGSNIKYYNLTQNTVAETTTSMNLSTSSCSGVVWFGSNYSYDNFTPTSDLSEKWSGNCYWMFCANRVLTDDEIQLVAQLNGM